MLLFRNRYTPVAALAPASVTLWTPLTLGSALRAWYAFDTLTGSNGDPQGSVTDASGNGFNLSQSGGTRPTLAAADLNSKNTLRFTGASSQRYPLSVSILSGSSVGAFYSVQKVVSAAAANGSPQWGTSGSQTYHPFSDGNVYDDFGSTVRKSCGASTGALTAYRIFSCYSAASDWKLFIDGGTGGSSGGTTARFATTTNTVGWAGAGVNLGANASITAFDGWYAEVFYVNSNADRQKAEGYLAHKWFGAGASNNLDATHPYKTTPP